MQFILQEIRKSKKGTQRQLSNKTGLSVSYIQKLEVGKRRKPSYEVVNKLAIALGVKSEELFLNEN